MSKKICKDHDERKGHKAKCGGCIHYADGSHRHLMEIGIVVRGRMARHLVETTHAINSIDRSDEEYF